MYPTHPYEPSENSFFILTHSSGHNSKVTLSGKHPLSQVSISVSAGSRRHSPASGHREVYGRALCNAVGKVKGTRDEMVRQSKLVPTGSRNGEAVTEMYPVMRGTYRQELWPLL